MFGSKKKKVIYGKLIFADKDKIVIDVKAEKVTFAKGQEVKAIMRENKTTALGKHVGLIDVIAKGPVSEVVGNHITIQSKASNPFVSKSCPQIIETIGNMVQINSLS